MRTKRKRLRRYDVAGRRVSMSGRFLASWVAACTIYIAAPPQRATAQDTLWNRYTLDGLSGVHVRTEVNQGCEGAGIAADGVRATAVALLEAAGIPLLSEEDMLASPGLSELRVSLECGGGVAGVVGHSVSVRVQQAAQMIRDTQITLSEAVTWWTSRAGVTEAGKTGDALDAALKAELNKFVQAFREANAEAGI